MADGNLSDWRIFAMYFGFVVGVLMALLPIYVVVKLSADMESFGGIPWSVDFILLNIYWAIAFVVGMALLTWSLWALWRTRHQRKTGY
jgi:hypothetical protein